MYFIGSIYSLTLLKIFKIGFLFFRILLIIETVRAKRGHIKSTRMSAECQDLNVLQFLHYHY